MLCRLCTPLLNNCSFWPRALLGPSRPCNIWPTLITRAVFASTVCSLTRGPKQLTRLNPGRVLGGRRGRGWENPREGIQAPDRVPLTYFGFCCLSFRCHAAEKAWPRPMPRACSLFSFGSFMVSDPAFVSDPLQVSLCEHWKTRLQVHFLHR